MHAREAEDFGFYRSGFGDGVNKIMLDFIEKHKLLVTAFVCKHSLAPCCFISYPQ